MQRNHSTTQVKKSFDNELPMLKTIKQMSRISGVGEGTLRHLVENDEIEYVSVGNRKLLANEAIWD